MCTPTITRDEAFQPSSQEHGSSCDTSTLQLRRAAPHRTCVNTVVPPASSTTPSMCIMCSRFQQVGAAKRAIKLPFCISAAPVVVRGSSLL